MKANLSQSELTKMESLEYEFPENKEKEGFLKICNDFAEMTTAHGIPNIITSKTLIWRLVWATIVITASLLFFIQGYKLLHNFYSFHTNVHLIHSETAEFPAVSICNFNMLRRSKLKHNKHLQEFVNGSDFWEAGNSFRSYGWLWDSGFSKLADSEIDKGSVSDARNNYDFNVISDNSWSSDYWYYINPLWKDSTLTEETFEQLVDNPWDLVKLADLTKKDLREIGHQAENFILNCKFNKRDCDERDFTPFQNKEYGNCFSFDIKRSNQSKRRISKAGSNYGLHLTLFIEYPEYIFTEEAGVRLLIHPRSTFPHPEEVGISLSPGFSTSIGIRQLELQRLKDPYGDCTDDRDNKGLNSNTIEGYEYGIVSCQKLCRQSHVREDCKCVDDLYTNDKTLPWCMGKKAEVCVQRVDKKYHTGKLECDCPAPCHETVYNTQVSASAWPVDSYASTLRKHLNKSVENLWKVWENTSVVRKNLVRVKIYFEELNYELIEQVPSTTVPGLLGTIGGLLGLYLGFSVITITEISFFVSRVIILLFKVSRR